MKKCLPREEKKNLPYQGKNCLTFTDGGDVVDRAKDAGRTNGADAYRRGGDGPC